MNIFDRTRVPFLPSCGDRTCTRALSKTRFGMAERAKSAPVVRNARIPALAMPSIMIRCDRHYCPYCVMRFTFAHVVFNFGLPDVITLRSAAACSAAAALTGALHVAHFWVDASDERR